MVENLSDKEQVELLKKWWNDYGKSILLAVIIGLGAGYGWRHYQAKKNERLVAASAVYWKMLDSDRARITKNANAAAGTLVLTYPNTVYATVAQFMLAKNAVQKHDYKEAIESLDWVMKHSNKTMFQDLARLREARVLIQEKKNKAALALLNEIHDKTFQPVLTRIRLEAKRNA